MRALSKREQDGKMLERPIIDYAFRKIISEKLGTESVYTSAERVKILIPKLGKHTLSFPL